MADNRWTGEIRGGECGRGRPRRQGCGVLRAGAGEGMPCTPELGEGDSGGWVETALFALQLARVECIC